MMKIERGCKNIRGVVKSGSSYVFGLKSESRKVKLLLFKKSGELAAEIPFTDEYRTGFFYCVRITGIKADHLYYCYEIDGHCVPDPCGTNFTNCRDYGRTTGEMVLSRVTLDDFDWEDDKPLKKTFAESVLYKLHVRGFTKSRTSGVKKKGTFAGIIEKIPYLKDLGITAIELMPAYEYDDCGRFPELKESIAANPYGTGQVADPYRAGPIEKPVNYWGYTDAYHFAPKASFCATKRADYTVEFKTMVKELHRAGIECLMEMYFTREDISEILSCLRHWVSEYHVDGFHFYGKPEALRAIFEDPILAETKIITVYWDGEKPGCRHMANANEGFLQTARKFLKGDDNQLADYIRVNRANPLAAANINYITNHDGFTMVDLVSYDRKHNEANGEGGRDGENFNFSWNCGEEGQTKKKKIVALRKKQLKNAFMMLLLSAGTPLIVAGDEFLNSQGGNNNPYCIDSEVTWTTWNQTKNASELRSFVKGLIAFRKKHRILHMEKELLGSDALSIGYPDISWHGTSAWINALENYDRHVGIMYCASYADPEDKELIYVAYNMHWEPHELALPEAAKDAVWTPVFGSAPEAEWRNAVHDRQVQVGPRSILVLTCKMHEEKGSYGKNRTVKTTDRRS